MPATSPPTEDAPKRTMQRQPKGEAETPQEAPEQSDTGEGMTKDQQAKMFAQFDELGIKAQADYRSYIAKVLSAEVKSSKELTKDQASLIIEAQIADLEASETVADELPVA